MSALSEYDQTPNARLLPTRRIHRQRPRHAETVAELGVVGVFPVRANPLQTSLMTTIARLTQEQAYLLKGRLESEQIPAFVLDEHANAGAPLVGDSFAGMRVQVPDEYVGRATAILRTIQEASRHPAPEPEPFVPRAKPVLTALNWVELVMTALFIIAMLYYFFQ